MENRVAVGDLDLKANVKLSRGGAVDSGACFAFLPFDLRFSVGEDGIGGNASAL